MGFDIGHDYDTDIIGFALNVTAKFLPAKVVSPFVSFQYDLKGGYYYADYDDYYGYSYYSEDEYPLFQAFNIAAGISFNFGRRH